MINDIDKWVRRHPHLKTSPVGSLPEGEVQEVGLVPEFIRLPRNGERCHFSGLSRATLNELILGTNPRVKSLYLRKPGTARGIRLIHLASLLAYLHREMARQLEEGSCVKDADGCKAHQPEREESHD